MAVDGIGSTGASVGLAAPRGRRIADNFDTFLQLLTTQLKNQNPLDPLDTNQFTQQLVQFTWVEQQLKTNEFLEAMMLSQPASRQARRRSAISARRHRLGQQGRTDRRHRRRGTSLEDAAPSHRHRQGRERQRGATPRPGNVRPARASSPGTASATTARRNA